MAIVTVQAYRCDVCGYKWLPRKDKLPTCCADNACRSRRWNGGSRGRQPQRLVRGRQSSDDLSARKSTVELPAPIPSVQSQPNSSRQAEACAECGGSMVVNKIMKRLECASCGYLVRIR